MHIIPDHKLWYKQAFMANKSKSPQMTCVQDSTFLSNFLGHVGNIEIFNVQLPQVGKLAEFGWKLSNSNIAVGRTGETTWLNKLL